MADSVETPAGEEMLESKLEEMLEIEKFEPHEGFRRNALLSWPAFSPARCCAATSGGHTSPTRFRS